MGFFDRFRKKKLPVCDWCRMPIDGTPIDRDGICFCSEDCFLDQSGEEKVPEDLRQQKD